MTDRSDGLTNEAAALAVALSVLIAEIDRGGDLRRRVTAGLWKKVEDQNLPPKIGAALGRIASELQERDAAGF